MVSVPNWKVVSEHVVTGVFKESSTDSEAVLPIITVASDGESYDNPVTKSPHMSARATLVKVSRLSIIIAKTVNSIHFRLKASTVFVWLPLCVLW